MLYTGLCAAAGVAEVDFLRSPRIACANFIVAVVLYVRLIVALLYCNGFGYSCLVNHCSTMTVAAVLLYLIVPQ